MTTKYFRNEKKMLAYLEENADKIVCVYTKDKYIVVVTRG